jgi:hypothetical protein
MVIVILKNMPFWFSFVFFVYSGINVSRIYKQTLNLLKEKRPQSPKTVTKVTIPVPAIASFSYVSAFL